MIRPARDDELEVLQEIEVASGELFRTIGMDAVADAPPTPLTSLGAAQRAGRLWVATVDDRPVGFALALLLDEPHLEQLSVHPRYGRQGVGTALVEQVAVWAREHGGTTLTLSTFLDVAWNGPLYRRLGFEVVPESELSPTFRELRQSEAGAGLDISRRAIMRRRL